MKTFLLFLLFIYLIIPFSFSQTYTKITLMPPEEGGDRINDNAVKTKKDITFSATYIFNNKYMYQTNKSISQLKEAGETIITGYIPEKLNNIKVMVYAFANGTAGHDLHVSDNTVYFEKDIYIDDNNLNSENSQSETIQTAIYDGIDRWYVYDAKMEIQYQIFAITSSQVGQRLCPNEIIEFNLPPAKDLLWNTYDVYYKDNYIKTLTHNNNTITISEFAGANILNPWSLVFKSYSYKNNSFIEGRYVDFSLYNGHETSQIVKNIQENNEKFGLGHYKRLFIHNNISTDLNQTFNFATPQENVDFDKPYIKDHYLQIDYSGPNKYCEFVLACQDVSQSYKATDSIPAGQYQLQISDIRDYENEYDKKCQVNLDAYVPNITYNRINNSPKYTHWHNGNYINALNLKIYSINEASTQGLIDVTPDSQYQQISNNSFEFKTEGKIDTEEVYIYEDNLRKKKKDEYGHVVKDQDGNDVFELRTLYYTPYTISCYPDLDSITIMPKDMEHSIYTIVTTDSLHAYPNITATAYIDHPHCNYDKAYLIFDKLEGGLERGYEYQIDKQTPQPIPADKKITLDPSLKNFQLKVFDNTNDIEKTGRTERGFSFEIPFYVNRPEALSIPAPSISHPLCTFDSNGSIAINTAKVKLSHDVDPIYTWSVIKGDKDNQTTTSIGLGPTISNLPAGFYQVELNNDNCIATGSYELTDPPLLEFESTTSSNAKCYGYSDGSIFISVKGGTGEHRYFWNVGARTKDLFNIPKGDYQLTVLDAHDCKITTDLIKIGQPTKVVNDKIAKSYSICQDSELEIDAGTFANYVWKNPQGIILTPEDYNILKLNNSSPEGEYYLKTIRYDDCFAEDKIKITQSKESLKMNFLLPSDIYNDDYAKIVETSSHELDSLKWSFSENLIGDFPKDSTTLTISTNALDKLSTYKIKLTGYYKGCISTVTKNLNISNLTRPEEEYIPDFYDSDEILDCRIGPNPNNGNFTLFLDLDCAKDAVLTIYSISSYKYVLREKLVGLQNYEHSINQNLQQGLYILEVKTPKSIRRIKFEVTK